MHPEKQEGLHKSRVGTYLPGQLHLHEASLSSSSLATVLGQQQQQQQQQLKETLAAGQPPLAPDATPTHQRLHNELVQKGFSAFRFVRVPADYYEQPLEYRQDVDASHGGKVQEVQIPPQTSFYLLYSYVAGKAWGCVGVAPMQKHVSAGICTMYLQSCFLACAQTNKLA
eukprot:1157405-Pelagomonas_calceolata.AAC.2